MRESGMCLCADVDLRAGAGGKFLVSGDKVGVKVSLEDVSDLEALLVGRFEIKINITLRIDDGWKSRMPPRQRRVVTALTAPQRLMPTKVESVTLSAPPERL